jgi:hypothetical protein
VFILSNEVCLFISIHTCFPSEEFVWSLNVVQKYQLNKNPICKHIIYCHINMYIQLFAAALVLAKLATLLMCKSLDQLLRA